MAAVNQRKIGHVVLNVSSLARSVPFYESLLGVHEVARMGEEGRKFADAEMVFFSFGDSHHDLALREVPTGTPIAPESLGLAHVASSSCNVSWTASARPMSVLSGAGTCPPVNVAVVVLTGGAAGEGLGVSCCNASITVAVNR